MNKHANQFDRFLIQSTHHAVSFILNTIDVLGSLSAAPATDRNGFLNLMAVSFWRVSMGLTERRKTAKNLVDSRKN